MGSFRTTERPESTAFHRRWVYFPATKNGCYLKWNLSYMSSRNWPSLVEALYQSTRPPFDHLVRLYNTAFPIPCPHPPSVKMVIFEDMNTIPDVLRPRSSKIQDHHLRRSGGFASAHANSRPSEVTIGGHVTSPADGLDGLGDMPNNDQRVEGVSEYTAQDASEASDGEEPEVTKEAIIIQRAARRFLKHIEISNDVLTIGRQRLFRSCKASANDVHVKYRKIYLGPVPHLLLCLEWLVTRTQGLKTAIKRRRGQATLLQEKLDLNVEHKQMR